MSANMSTNTCLLTPYKHSKEEFFEDLNHVMDILCLKIIFNFLLLNFENNPDKDAILKNIYSSLKFVPKLLVNKLIEKINNFIEDNQIEGIKTNQYFMDFKLNHLIFQESYNEKRVFGEKPTFGEKLTFGEKPTFGEKLTFGGNPWFKHKFMDKKLMKGGRFFKKSVFEEKRKQLIKESAPDKRIQVGALAILFATVASEVFKPYSVVIDPVEKKEDENPFAKEWEKEFGKELPKESNASQLSDMLNSTLEDIKIQYPELLIPQNTSLTYAANPMAYEQSQVHFTFTREPQQNTSLFLNPEEHLYKFLVEANATMFGKTFFDGSNEQTLNSFGDVCNFVITTFLNKYGTCSQITALLLGENEIANMMTANVAINRLPLQTMQPFMGAQAYYSSNETSVGTSNTDTNGNKIITETPEYRFVQHENFYNDINFQLTEYYNTINANGTIPPEGIIAIPISIIRQQASYTDVNGKKVETPIKIGKEVVHDRTRYIIEDRQLINKGKGRIQKWKYTLKTRDGSKIVPNVESANIRDANDHSSHSTLILLRKMNINGTDTVQHMFMESNNVGAALRYSLEKQSVPLEGINKMSMEQMKKLFTGNPLFFKQDELEALTNFFTPSNGTDSFSGYIHDVWDIDYMIDPNNPNAYFEKDGKKMVDYSKLSVKLPESHSFTPNVIQPLIFGSTDLTSFFGSANFLQQVQNLGENNQPSGLNKIKSAAREYLEKYATNMDNECVGDNCKFFANQFASNFDYGKRGGTKKRKRTKRNGKNKKKGGTNSKKRKTKSKKEATLERHAAVKMPTLEKCANKQKLIMLFPLDDCELLLYYNQEILTSILMIVFDNINDSRGIDWINNTNNSSTPSVLDKSNIKIFNEMLIEIVTFIEKVQNKVIGCEEIENFDMVPILDKIASLLYNEPFNALEISKKSHIIKFVSKGLCEFIEFKYTMCKKSLTTLREIIGIDRFHDVILKSKVMNTLMEKHDDNQNSVFNFKDTVEYCMNGLNNIKFLFNNALILDEIEMDKADADKANADKADADKANADKADANTDASTFLHTNRKGINSRHSINNIGILKQTPVDTILDIVVNYFDDFQKWDKIFEDTNDFENLLLFLEKEVDIEEHAGQSKYYDYELDEDTAELNQYTDDITSFISPPVVPDNYTLFNSLLKQENTNYITKDLRRKICKYISNDFDKPKLVLYINSWISETLTNIKDSRFKSILERLLGETDQTKKINGYIQIMCVDNKLPNASGYIEIMAFSYLNPTTCITMYQKKRTAYDKIHFLNGNVVETHDLTNQKHLYIYNDGSQYGFFINKKDILNWINTRFRDENYGKTLELFQQKQWVNENNEIVSHDQYNTLYAFYKLMEIIELDLLESDPELTNKYDDINSIVQKAYSKPKSWYFVEDDGIDELTPHLLSMIDKIKNNQPAQIQPKIILFYIIARVNQTNNESIENKKIMDFIIDGAVNPVFDKELVVNADDIPSGSDVWIVPKSFVNNGVMIDGKQMIQDLWNRVHKWKMYSAQTKSGKKEYSVYSCDDPSCCKKDIRCNSVITFEEGDYYFVRLDSSSNSDSVPQEVKASRSLFNLWGLWN